MTIQVFGSQATVSALNRAFTDTSPANAIFNNQVARAEKIGDQAFANEFGASFASLSNAELSKKVLTNLGVLPSTEASVVALEQAVTDYFAAFGAKTTASNGQVTADTRGFIVLQLASILSGLENATGSLSVYAATALAWNSEVANSYSYSSNVNNTTPTQTGTTGQSLTLTVNQDTINGGTGDDTINSPVNIAASQMTDTLQSVDTIDGGAGNDTLNVTLGQNIISVAPNVSNVENVAVRFANPTTLNLGSSQGVTSIAVSNSNTIGAIQDIGTVASLSIKNQNTGLWITGTTNSATTMALNLDTVGTKTESAVNPIQLSLGSVVASKVTTANITANNAYVNVDSSANDVITTAAITATGTNTLLFTDSATTLTKITATGDGSLNLKGTPATPNAVAFSKVTTLDASALKGAVTAEIANTAKAVTVTTGTGNDYVKVPAVVTTGSTATMGAGDDVLIVGNNLGAFDKVNGGDGIDIINITNGLGTAIIAAIGASAAVPAVIGVAGVTETATVTWADNRTAAAGDTITVGDMIITIATPSFATPANLAAVAASQTSMGTDLVVSFVGGIGGPSALWTTAAGSAIDKTVFTSLTADTNVTDLSASKAGAAIVPTVATTQQGTAQVIAVPAVAAVPAQAAVTPTTYKNISNFETLDISGAKAGGTTYNLSLNNFPTVQIDEAIAGSLLGAVILDKAPDNFALTLASKAKDGDFNVGQTITVQGKDYAGTTATNDAETFTLIASLNDDSKGNVADGNITTSGITVLGDSVENVVIQATVTKIDGGTDATANKTSSYSLTPMLTITGTETITIKGDASVNFTNSAFTAAATYNVSKVDASASTGNITLDMSGVGTPNGAGAIAFNAVSYTGSAGVDTYTASSKGDMIYTGKGGDVITLSTAVAAAAPVLAVPEVRETLVFKAATDSQLTDVSKDGKATLDADMASGTTVDTINMFKTAAAAFASGDRIDLTNFGFTSAQRGAEDISSKFNTSTDLTNVTGFFNSVAGVRGVAFAYAAGNAYVFVDANKDGNFTAADDLVIKLAGVTTGIAEADFNF